MTNEANENENEVVTTSNGVEVIESKFEYLDANLDTKEAEIKVNFTPPATAEDGMQRLGGDSEKLLKAITNLLRSEAIDAAESTAIPADAINKSFVVSMAVPYRSMPQFARVAPESRADQTKKIFAYFKSKPSVMAMLREESKNV